MGSKNDARIHTGGRDRDCSARAACRCTAAGVPTLALASESEWYEESSFQSRATRAWETCIATTPTGDESVDGLHPRNEG